MHYARKTVTVSYNTDTSYAITPLFCIELGDNVILSAVKLDISINIASNVLYNRATWF